MEQLHESLRAVAAMLDSGLISAEEAGEMRAQELARARRAAERQEKVRAPPPAVHALFTVAGLQLYM